MATPRRSPLRAVAPDERPPRRRPTTITAAAAEGTTRELLVAMRARVAVAVEDPNCPPRDLAALTRRLQELVRDIAALDAQDEEAAVGAQATDGRFDASAV